MCNCVVVFFFNELFIFFVVTHGMDPSKPEGNASHTMFSLHVQVRVVILPHTMSSFYSKFGFMRPKTPNFGSEEGDV